MIVALFFLGFLGCILLICMILTLVSIHKDVYKKPPQYKTHLHMSKQIYNYPIWMQKLSFHYTTLGAVGFFALIFTPITVLLDTYISEYEVLISIISCCVIFVEYILYKGYDTFAKELRIKKYKKKLKEIEFDRDLDLISDHEFNVAKARILKFKS